MKILKENFCEILSFLLLTALCGLLIAGKGYSYAVKNGLTLFITAVFPSVFPYLFLTSVFSSLSLPYKLCKRLSPLTKKILNTSGTAFYAFLLGGISGYPIGAKIISELYQKKVINEAEAVRCASFCSTCSPMFLITGVGANMLSNSLKGVFILFINLLSALLTGFSFSFYKRKDKPQNVPIISAASQTDLFFNGVSSAIAGSLTVCGIITLFSLFCEILLSVGILSPAIKIFSSAFNDEQLAKGLVLGIIECTGGLKTISATNHPLSISVACFLCCFGGISVIIQSVAYLKKAKVKTIVFLFAKLLCGTIGFILSFLLAPLFF